MSEQGFDALLGEMYATGSPYTEAHTDLLFDAAGICTDRQWRIVQGLLEWLWQKSVTKK